MSHFRLAFVAAFLSFVSLCSTAHDVPGPEMKSEIEIAKACLEMANAANALINSVPEEQQKKMMFEFKDAEREKFIFVPAARKGLSMKEMPAGSRPLAIALLNTGLSQHGANAAMSIMSLEQYLLVKEAGKGPLRDAENYFVQIFGKPGNDQIWAWRWEGHHFSASFTCVMGKAIIAPVFMGANPTTILDGPRKGHQTLIEVELTARKFVESLDEAQKKKAVVYPETPKDIFSMTKRRIDTKKEGIPAGELKPEQKALMMGVVKEYLRRERPEIAARDLARIEKEGVDGIHFAWGGSTEVGKTHYYRLQSDTFLIEYDNFQNDGNHIHSVYRDLKNDFGEDVLKRHYELEHK